MSKKKINLYLILLFINNTCNTFYMIGLPLLTYQITGSAAGMAIVGVAESIPLLILGPFLGTLVDKFNSKKSLIITEMVQLIFISMLSFVPILKDYSFPIIVAIAVVISVNVQMNKIAFFKIIPQLFPDDVISGNAKVSTIFTATDVIGPIVASVIISASSTSLLFIIDGLTSLFMALFLLSLKLNNVEEPIENENMFISTILGFKFVFANRQLRFIVIISLISTLGDGGLLNLIIYALRSDYSLPESSVSLVVGAFSFATFIGTLIVRFLKMKDMNKLFSLGLIVNNFGLFFLLFNGWYNILISLFIIGIGTIFFSISRNSIIHLNTPSNMLGRVNNTVRLLSQVTVPLSISVLMWLSSEFNTRYAYIFSIVMATFCSFLLLKNLTNKKIDEGG